MKNLIIPTRIRDKIYNHHGVVRREVEECFAAKLRPSLIDIRARNATVPPTEWFIAETKTGRRLKVVYIYFADSDAFVLKTAYEPDANEGRSRNVCYQTPPPQIRTGAANASGSCLGL